MPENQQKYVEWTSERFVSWAERIGENTTVVIKHLLSYHKVPQQGYKTCMALLKLGDKYSVIRLEAACKKALFYTSTPSFKNIQTILANGQDKLSDEPVRKTPSVEYSFTRGADYYDRRG